MDVEKDAAGREGGDGMKITNYSECDTDYVKAVKKCKTLDELRQITTEYRELAEDAYQIAQKMDEDAALRAAMGVGRKRHGAQLAAPPDRRAAWHRPERSLCRSPR